MATWLVRAGRDGANEDFALESGYAVLGWHELPDLRQFASKAELSQALRDAGHSNDAAIRSHTSQIWTFVHKIQRGDTVTLPLRSVAAVALGEVVGDYEYDPTAAPGVRHRRRVRWVRDAVPRNAFGQDLLYTLGAFLTVCRVQRNDADTRIARIMAGQTDPGMGAGPNRAQTASETTEEDLGDAAPFDLEQYGRDRIASIISRNFAGHELTALVNAVLQASGYHTIVSPAGPDGGVDILAGAPPMGFGEPRICVQVKTGEADAPMLRDLQGTMHAHGATHGLFVAWGGYKRTVRIEERRTFFQIRLWDADDLIRELIAVYPQLPAAIRDAIPLTQVWTVVEDDPRA
ncbi:MAG: restriction endonuclease [Demequina sp.]|nr:restriction endonuclease [Demequina sp.]